MRAIPVAVVLLALAGQAGASQITFTFDFSASLAGGPGSVVVSPFPSSGPMTVEAGLAYVLPAFSVEPGDSSATEQPFTLHVGLKDIGSSDEGGLSFTGTAGGSLAFDGTLTDHVDLGGWRYEGTLLAETGSPFLNLSITVTALQAVPAPPYHHSTPEPSSLLLGLSALLLGHRRFRTAGRRSP